MSYTSYIKGLESCSVSINSEISSIQEIQKWAKEEVEDIYITKIKKVYNKWFDESDRFEISTSGSTGNPKLIALSKEKMYNSAINSLAYFKLIEGDKVLLVLPADKVGGIMLIIRSIIGGLNLVHRRPSLTPFINESDEKFKFCSITPAQLSTSISNGIDKELSNIDNILLGGSAVDQKLLNYIDRQNNLYFNSYGMTETISHVAIQQLNGAQKSDYFIAIGNARFDQNADKCLIIYAPEIVDEVLVTNDVIELKSETKMKWIARFDNIVNSGGIKLIPEEIEQKITKVIPYDFYLTGEKDPILGERLVMLVKTGIIKSEDVKKLAVKVFAILEKHERPKFLYATKAFNYTKNRKLIRSKPNQLSVMGYKFA